MLLQAATFTGYRLIGRTLLLRKPIQISAIKIMLVFSCAGKYLFEQSADLGINTGQHGWDVGALDTASTLHSSKQHIQFSIFFIMQSNANNAARTNIKGENVHP